MRALDRSVCQVADLREQPETTHVVIPPNGDSTPIGVDWWAVGEHEFIGYIHAEGKSISVVAFPADAPWVVYSRALAKPISREEAARQTAADVADVKALNKELYPDQKSVTQALGDSMAVVRLPGVEADEAPDPGHGIYL